MTDENPDDSDRVAELAEQVEALEQQVERLTPDVSRRQALQGGAAVGLGALLGGGATLGATRSARAAPDADDVGAPNDHVDLYAQNLYDVNGNQFDSFDDRGFVEASVSPITSPSLDTQYDVSDVVGSAGTIVLFIQADVLNGSDGVYFQIDGKTGSSYTYESIATAKTTDSKGLLVDSDIGGRVGITARLGYGDKFNLHWDTQTAWGYLSSAGFDGSPDTIEFQSPGSALEKVEIYGSPMY